MVVTNMASFFITGTDTNVGKTLASAVLVQALKKDYWKPIQSGFPLDKEIVQQWTGLPEENFFPSCYQFNANLAPDQAANLENRLVNLAQCSLPYSKKGVIIEGAGGVLVPLNETDAMVDLIRQLSLPVVVVARGVLGTINHTLLTIEALRQRHISIHGVIFNGELSSLNQNAIETRGKVRTLFSIPYFEKLTADSFQQWVKEHENSIKESFV